MKLKFTKINGTNPYLNYDRLKESIKNKWETTCDEAEVLLLNNLPATISSKVDIDLLIILHIPDIRGNYYNLTKDDTNINIKNRIIAVSLQNEFYNKEIEVSRFQILTKNALIELDDKISDLRWGSINYLSNRCGLTNIVNVMPLIWVRNKFNQFANENIVVGDDLNYDLIEGALKNNHSFKYQGYKDWQKSDINFELKIKTILEQASLDSEEGYLTKNKIDRLQNKFTKAREKAFTKIGEQLVEVKGKAGTGKTADLLKWMLHNSLDGNKGLLLTYNHLLVNDLAFQIKSFKNRLSNSENKVSTQCSTIQSFFYNIAKKFGILIFMSESRINELDDTLKSRLRIIEDYFDIVRKNEDRISLAKLKMFITNRWEVSLPVRKQALVLLTFLQEKETFLPSKTETKKLITNFREDKLRELQNIENKNVFINDYHNVLNNILKALLDTSSFIKEFNIQDKYEELNLQLGTFKKHLLEENGSGKMNFERLKTRYKRGLGGFRYGRTLYIDEAQDCHRYEKDIMVALFGSENIVVANGGEEQLIRYQNICNWRASLGRKLAYHQYSKRPKSFRMKPAIAKLANHIAKRYNINLNIEPDDTEDHGLIWIDNDKSEESSSKDISVIMDLLSKGERQGCTNYESLIMLRPPQNYDKNKGSNSSDKNKKSSSVVVDENDIILDKKISDRQEWKTINKAQEKIESANFWDATGNTSKREMHMPGALSIRSIYYESCRGLEAWSVMNFGLDSFFDSKWNEKDAERYRLEDMLLSEQERREMYAATWILMSVTRSIENCYIQLNDLNSSLSKCILNFASDNEQYIEML